MQEKLQKKIQGDPGSTVTGNRKRQAAFSGQLKAQDEKMKNRNCHLLFICMMVFLMFLNACANRQETLQESYPFVHLPLREADESSSTGMKTTWSCISFGSYPSAEVTAGDWNSVESYALKQGDLIVDEKLYAKLEAADWLNDRTTVDQEEYVRLAASDAVSEKDSQHYIDDGKASWHYFKVMPLIWRILDIENGEALLLADRIADCLPFNVESEAVNWETSTLRSWLNGYKGSENLQHIDYSGNGFYDLAFNEQEKEAIILSHISNPANQDYGTDSGGDSDDRVFLLSNEEVFAGPDAERYGFDSNRGFDDPAKRFTSTLYAKYKGCWYSPVDAYAGNSFWFMRTSGYTPENVTYICDFGFVYARGTLVSCNDAGVLPAMRVNLDRMEIRSAGERCSSDIMHKNRLKEPQIFSDEKLPGGQYTIWTEVSFGEYPQSQILKEDDGFSEGSIVDSVLWESLEKLSDGNDGDYVLDDQRYIRLHECWFKYEPINWRVLAADKESVLLFADRIMDCVAYNREFADVNWADCDLRSWLNTGDLSDDPEYGMSFIDRAFSEKQKEDILVSELVNADNHYFNTYCGPDTADKVFLLSEEEIFSSDLAKNYGFIADDAIDDPGRKMPATPYAIERGAWVSLAKESDGVGFWFLRSNGYTSANVVYVGERGCLYNRGIPLSCSDGGIVPALRVKLDAADLKIIGEISSKQ